MQPSGGGGSGGGGTADVWVQFASHGYLKFPHELADFEDFLIAGACVLQHVSGTGKKDLYPGASITLKGKMPSASPLFKYLLRVRKAKPDPNNRYEQKHGGGAEGRYGMPAKLTYDILPEAGFRDCDPLPWTVGLLKWALCNERVSGFLLPTVASRAVSELFPSESDYVEYRRGAVNIKDDEPIPTSKLEKAPFWDDLRATSEYYRLQSIVAVRYAWPGNVPEIRKMPSRKVKALAEHLSKAPHELCFHRFSKVYGLGEMTFTHLKQYLAAAKERKLLVADNVTKPVEMTAVALYQWIRDSRIRFCHTAFYKDELTKRFKYEHSMDEHGPRTEAAMAWLLREKHLLVLGTENALEISDRTVWFSSNVPVMLQIPRDNVLQERILAHLRRIFRNFLEDCGDFSMRDAQGCVPAVPKGACNARQREAVDHVLNNPITIIQGGPGSGKTFTGIVHLATFFDWMEIQTHVGRQSVALCDLLGGCTENATTVHGTYHRLQGNTIRMEYLQQKQLLVGDEVYNMSDKEMEMFLSSAPRASRLVLIGDPDQIRPIPGESGAGTPALDIARAFPQHVIYLDENMRQRADALAIHGVVTAIRMRLPGSIDWGRTLDDPVMFFEPCDSEYDHTSDAFSKKMEDFIFRLRRDIGSEHDWQIITLYNGTNSTASPGQTPGVRQLNETVEAFFERRGLFADGSVIRHQITRSLNMYVGMKFVITERFTPDSCITPEGLIEDHRRGDGAKGAKGKGAARGSMFFKNSKSKQQQKKKRDRDDAARKKNAAQGRTVYYDDTKNGQIEVAKFIQEIPVPGSGRSRAWMVTCEPKGKCSRGTRILINKTYHVDPNCIYPAWAVTSNKSMGGECKNVLFVLPKGAANSPFDNSHVYVACSRPMNWLGVFGRQADFAALVRKDPLPVNSGLYKRLHVAKLMPEDQQNGQIGGAEGAEAEEMVITTLDACDWKAAQDFKSHGYLNADKLACVGDIYDQRHRQPFPFPMPVCPVSYLEFRHNRQEELSAMKPKECKEEMESVQQEWDDTLWKFETPLSRLRLEGKNNIALHAIDPKAGSRRQKGLPDLSVLDDTNDGPATADLVEPLQAPTLEDTPDDQREEEEHKIAKALAGVTLSPSLVTKKKHKIAKVLAGVTLSPSSVTKKKHKTANEDADAGEENDEDDVSPMDGDDEINIDDI